MRQTIRLFLLVEGVAFAIATLFHYGVVIDGYQHREAAIAETVIGTVLLASFLLTLAAPVWTRLIGILAQTFALLGTLVGVFTIAVGVGPRTVPDVVYHVAILTVLGIGLVVAARAPADEATEPA